MEAQGRRRRRGKGGHPPAQQARNPSVMVVQSDGMPVWCGMIPRDR